MALIRLKRGTRAQLQSAASGGELHEGEPYYVTDEERVAVGTGTSGFVESVTPGDLAEVATSGSYDDLDDKPSIPSSPGDIGARPAGDVPWGDVSDKPATFPPAPHTHSIGEVSGLQSALDGKQPEGDYLTEGDLPDLSGYVETSDPRLSDARTPLPHAHVIGDVTGLQSELDSKGTSDLELGTTSTTAKPGDWEPDLSGYYTKSEVDGMIGDIDTVLNNILGA